MRSETNQLTYEDANVVGLYDAYRTLTKGEKKILAEFKQLLEGKDLLDIGMGAGRTTNYFLPLVKSYKGIDYSSAMVAHCKTRFKDMAKASFTQDDARVISSCADSSFDTVFFSFNGIDCVDMDGRKKIIGQANRVLKQGGHFIFSFHNAGNVERLYTYQWAKNPFKWRTNWLRVKKLAEYNGPASKYTGQDFFIIKDGGEDFKLDIAYVRPSYQRQMMQEANFEVVGIVDDVKGQSLDKATMDQSETAWIYFVCKKL